MGIEEAIHIPHEALILVVKLTLPTIAVTTALGMALTLFQMVTQANDQTIQTVFKIALTLIVVFLTAPAMLTAIREYTIQIFEHIDALHVSGITPRR
jgi:flagellar biosynthetic protein FliQ